MLNTFNFIKIFIFARTLINIQHLLLKYHCGGNNSDKYKKHTIPNTWVSSTLAVVPRTLYKSTIIVIRELLVRVNTMSSELTIQVRDSDVSKWSDGFTKLTVNEVCKKFGIDIESDKKNAFFWNVQLNKKVLINEDLLDWLGYRGEKYSHKKGAIAKLLKKNPHVKFTEISDDCDVRKTFYLVDAIDFEGLLMQMRTPKVIELRDLFSLMKFIMVKYCEYEKYHEKHTSELLRQQNSCLMSSVNELKSLVLAVKNTADEEQQKAEERERKAEEGRQKAEERERKAEEERVRAEERECRAIQRSELLTAQIETNVRMLREKIAPNVVPPPINRFKRRNLGLYSSGFNQWYLMRRQEEGWRDAEKRMENRGMYLVRKWIDVSHAVDVGNEIKRRLRTSLKWYARGNTIKKTTDEPTTITDAQIEELIDGIISHENAAHLLAHENAVLI